MLHGFLNVDKPAGMTSHDVVARVRRLAAQKRVGHGGTLDPAATGVLPVALGEATRLLEYLVDGRKRYHAAITLGVTTTTDDGEGDVLTRQPVPDLAPRDLEPLLRSFVGEIQQVPPAYSAIQVAGQRMYDLARRGVEVDLPPRTVEVDAIQIVAWQPPVLTLDITCGKGTYIRALARDLGRELGCGAHLHALRRTAVGPLTIDHAVPLAELAADSGRLSHVLAPPEAAVLHLERVDLTEDAQRRVRNGLGLELSVTTPALLRAHATDGRLLALLRYDAAAWRPFKVFTWR